MSYIYRSCARKKLYTGEKNELWTLYLNFDRQIFERNANANAKKSAIANLNWTGKYRERVQACILVLNGLYKNNGITASFWNVLVCGGGDQVLIQNQASAHQKVDQY